MLTSDLMSLLSTARRCSSPEDCHLHHGVRLPVPPPPHLHLVVPLAPAPLEPPRHPQEPGSNALLLWARLSAWHQSDWQPGECTFSPQQIECMYTGDTLQYMDLQHILLIVYGSGSTCFVRRTPTALLHELKYPIIDTTHHVTNVFEC